MYSLHAVCDACRKRFCGSIWCRAGNRSYKRNTKNPATHSEACPEAEHSLRDGPVFTGSDLQSLPVRLPGGRRQMSAEQREIQHPIDIGVGYPGGWNQFR